MVRRQVVRRQSCRNTTAAPAVITTGSVVHTSSLSRSSPRINTAMRIIRYYYIVLWCGGALLWLYGLMGGFTSIVASSAAASVWCAL